MKLLYFDLRGRAEGIRFIFAQAGADYEDDRVERERWAEMKAKMPLGQMPVLVDGDKQLAQSVAIGRYVARKHNLVGANDWEAAECDMVVDTVQDLIPKLRPTITALFANETAKVKEELATFKTETLPGFLTFLAGRLTANGDWTVGKQVTWADLWTGEMIARLTEIDPTLVDGHDSVKAFVARVHALPNIKAYVDKRPKTNF